MAQDNFCEQCSARQSCRNVYEQLGRAEGPSVTFRVLTAFVLPIVVFIGVLAVLEGILSHRIDALWLRTALSCLPAFVAGFLAVLGTRLWAGQHGKTG